MSHTIKIIRTSTIPVSLNIFCKGLFQELQEKDGYNVIVVSSPSNELVEIAERERVRTIAVSMERRISFWNDLKSLIRLVKVFHKERPQMVHSITPKAGLLSMIAAWICRVPVRLHTFTGLVFPTATGLTQKILILTDRLTCACATHIVPEGEGIRHDLINYNITKKPLKILGYGNIRGIDTEYYSIENKDVKAVADKIRMDGVFTFVFVGRLVRDKGINELIEAFVKLNKEYVNTRLILVGAQEPELDPLLPETIKEIDSNKSIMAVGSQRDVRPWFAASDALVFPSYREGFPNVVIEAGAFGLPSIVTDINGSREIIIEGKNGTIIPVRDVKALYNAMRKFIEEQDYTAMLAQNARPLITSRYEQMFVRKCLREYYKEILSNV